MWIKKYNKNNELEQCVELGEEGNVCSFYSLKGKEFIRYNQWDKKKVVNYRLLDDDSLLVEGQADHKFFRTIKKTDSKTLLFPKTLKEYEIENGKLINFDIKPDKINSWKNKIR